MIKLKSESSTPSNRTTAQTLIDKGHKPRLPLEELRRSLLKRLRSLQEQGLDDDQVLQALFPSTILNNDSLQVVVSTLLAGNHIVLFGPPGSGKTNLAA